MIGGENAHNYNGSRAIAPKKTAKEPPPRPRTIAPWMIAPEENCPPSPHDCPPDNFSNENFHTRNFPPKIIALTQVNTSERVLQVN